MYIKAAIIAGSFMSNNFIRKSVHYTYKCALYVWVYNVHYIISKFLIFDELLELIVDTIK